ncbi:MAG: ribose 5-phosphate isomerase B [Gammaproteobacteria bacterium]|jgi:ribose 5-phosphate isomerase B|nr:ribose 5-phosphate isomerase B [Gammaproteobacteria bacterium]
MKVIIGCDHAGYDHKLSVKTYLKNNNIKLEDLGADNCNSVDYPDYAHAVAKEVQKDVNNRGVLVCGSANGVAITANKHKGIRAAICWNEETAKLAVTHNDANIICIPARFITIDVQRKILDNFFKSEFEGGRHKKRVEKIDLD